MMYEGSTSQTDSSTFYGHSTSRRSSYSGSSTPQLSRQLSDFQPRPRKSASRRRLHYVFVAMVLVLILVTMRLYRTDPVSLLILRSWTLANINAATSSSLPYGGYPIQY